MESREKTDKEWRRSFPYALCHFSTSGGAVAIATTFTHPLDVVKVRLQMQLVGQRGPLAGMGETFGKIIKVQGARGLYHGLSPALTRSALYGDWIWSFFWGACNCVDQSNGGSEDQVADELRRRSYREIYKVISEEGIGALWKGVGPAMARASALTASQLTTYDESKQALLRWTNLEEGFHLHLISSCAAGTVGTLVTAPMDMIKTRLMLQRDSRGAGSSRNVFHCAYQVILTEGVGALYKGGFAIFARLGPQTTITFIVCEKLRGLAGINAM